MIRCGGANTGAAALAALFLSACAAPVVEGRSSSLTWWEGAMRTERAPADAPFTNRDLAENFVTVALRVETDGGAAPQTLSRWEGPIRYRLQGRGATGADDDAVKTLSRRLSRLTGLSIDRVAAADDPNLWILFLDPEERAALVDDARRGEPTGVPGGDADFYDGWAADDASPCAFLFWEGEVGISSAVVLIKQETTGLLRESCIHEEVVQALGLTNDADHIRPSLFNDDEEFALMTSHDEYLTRILYDRRLSSGMSEAEVRALLPEILEDLRPEGGGCCV